MEELLKEKIAKAIAEYPKNQKELTNELGLARNTLSNWKNKLPETVIDFVKLVQILGVDINEGTETNHKYKRIHELLDDLDDKELIKMEMVIEDAHERIMSRRVTSSASRDTG